MAQVETKPSGHGPVSRRGSVVLRTLPACRIHRDEEHGGRSLSNDAEHRAAVTVHALRHSFGAHLRMAGVNLADIADLLGHKDLATTQIYAKVQQEHLRSIVFERCRLLLPFSSFYCRFQACKRDVSGNDTQPAVPQAVPYVNLRKELRGSSGGRASVLPRGQRIASG